MKKEISIINVVGARPNFIKISPIIKEINNNNFVTQKLIHTGQHYGNSMSDIFFKELDLPKPDYFLEVGKDKPAIQIAHIISKLSPILEKLRPDWVFVFGDVNSSLAAALAAAKMGIKVAHIEAGLRSFDKDMPEEINRILIDNISSLLFTPSIDANINLINEGHEQDKIHMVGNIMIDSLLNAIPKAEKVFSELDFKLKEKFVLVTLHRPSNVDNQARLSKIINALNKLSKDIQIVFPIHPRTQKAFKKFNISPLSSNILCLEPKSYLVFLALQMNAQLVITDSGGVQEETTFLKKPCITLRNNTERPITILKGTNKLVKHNDNIYDEVKKIIYNEKNEYSESPEFWDGDTAKRIINIIRPNFK